MLLGLAAYSYRDTPIGNVLLGAAGSVVGVALVFFLNEVFFGRKAPA